MKGEQAAVGTAAWRAQQPSFLGDVATTTLAQAVTVAANAASLAVISRRLGDVDLGVYTLERRAMAFLQPLVLLGLSVATPRYIALWAKRHEARALSYAAVGLLLVFLTSGVAALVVVLIPEPFAAVVFGDSSEVALTRVLGGFVFVTALYQVTYSVCRGYLHIARANLLEVSVVGAFPLLLAAWGPTDIVDFMWSLNAAVAVATIAVAMTEFGPRLAQVRPRLAAHGTSAKELLRFGLARTPGDIAAVALFAIAPIAVVHWGSVVDAGYASVAISSVNLVSVAAVPLGVLLLPRVADHASRPAGIPVQQYALLGEATMDVAIALGGILFVASPLVAAFWLPDAPDSLITAVEVAALGLPGYVFYLVFRSYLDAVDVRPLSSVATLSGLGILLVALPVALAVGSMPAPVAATAALSLALTVVGGVTFELTRRRIHGLGRRGRLFAVGIWLPFALVLGLVSRDGAPALVGGATCVAAGTLALSLVAAHPRWLQVLRERLRASRHSAR